jgi:Obg family GTPase CgtA
MFIDKAIISVQAGNGGDGAVSFHREKYVQRGGPNGGDGGKGGSVYFRATRNSHTLQAFRYQRKYKAENGENGGKKNQTGGTGADLVIDVPPGTLVRDRETGDILLDLFDDGDKKLLLRGGRGGRGNARFATPTRQAPRFATPGQRTQPVEVQLELRTIADVGLIGMPNVGKSSILTVLTAARPKVANYHFTTLAPNLGVVQIDEDEFVLADIPGLIEGASEGAGLGHDFLRHVERTRLLLHVLDASGLEGRDPLADFDTISEEIAAYSSQLGALPQIVVANKMDLQEAREAYPELEAQLATRGFPVFAVSAATQEGFAPLLRAVVTKLKELPEPRRFEERGEVEQRDMSAYTVTREEDGVFIVDGPLVDRLLLKTDPDSVESMRHFQQQLIRSGIIERLRSDGAADGDTVVMGDVEFDFVD